MGSRSRASASPAAVLATLVGVTACTSAATDRSSDSSGATVPAADCVVAAAGDVAGESDFGTGAARTADLISSARPEKVLALGDLAYREGTAAEFADYYDPTWGRFRSITAPTPGNHEYLSDGKGYYDYFDVEPNYAFDVCGWHLVSVDQYASEDDAVAFIEQEGRAAADQPLLVYWHEPRFSSGSEHGSSRSVQPLWEAAVAAGADVVLNAHDHNYERFEPMDEDGDPRPDGTVQFVSGNGGHNLRELGDREAHSAIAIEGPPGVLFLTLRDDGYDWNYRDVEGGTTDSGTRQLP